MNTDDRIALAKEFVQFIKETDSDVGLEIITYALMDKVEAIVKNNFAQAHVIKSVCPKCDGKGWYFVNEWIGSLQGRKDCSCGGQTVL